MEEKTNKLKGGFGLKFKVIPQGLKDVYGQPPFSVLNAREGTWQNRKRKWLSIGLQSELGRGDNLLKFSEKAQLKKKNYGVVITGKISKDIDHYRNDKKGLGQCLQTNIGEKYGRKLTTGTSIFDPVLCELLYNWFCPINGTVLDPFCGGSVRGIVAGFWNHPYTGFDLRQEQVESNYYQLGEINEAGIIEKDPKWICDDSGNMNEYIKDEKFDYVFSCHPDSVLVTTKKRGPISIKDVELDEKVLTHKGNFKRVYDKLERDYNGNIYEITRDYWRGKPLLLTEEHPLLIKRIEYPDYNNKKCLCGCGGFAKTGLYIRGHNNKNHKGKWGEKTKSGTITRERIKEESISNIFWARANKIKKGDYLLEPIPKEPKTPIDGEVVWKYIPPIFKNNRGARTKDNFNIKATKEICLLFGYYLAEGTAWDYMTQFSFHKNEKDYHNDVMSIWRKYFKGKTKLQLYGDDCNSSSIHCFGVVPSQFLHTGGFGAKNKHFPDWIWKCSNKLLKEVIKGAWRGDGYYASDGDTVYNTISERLMNDIRRGLLRFGIVSSVRLREVDPCYIGDNKKLTENPFPLWEIRVKGCFRKKMAELLDTNPDLPKWSRPGRSPFIKDGYVHYKIQKINKKPVKNLKVYNLEVEEDHSYIADGIVSHNCPPYGDLEVYSDDPKDLSNKDYNEFLKLYDDIIFKACEHLKENRFACFVVANFRDKSTGTYHDFVGDTIFSFKEAGLKFYNEIILVNSIGTLPIRVGKQFSKFRKIGKTHQNILVFYKGENQKNISELKFKDHKNIEENLEGEEE